MSVEVAKVLGCNEHCKAGQLPAELLTESFSPEVLAGIQTYIEEHPCKFVIEGNCRMVEYLIRREMGLSLQEHHLESPRMKPEYGR